MACFSIDLEKNFTKAKSDKGGWDQSSFFSTTFKQRQNALTWVDLRWSALVCFGLFIHTIVDISRTSDLFTLE